MPALIQPAFGRGEIGPHLYGRVDTAAYFAALRTAWNVFVHSYGGVSNRGGLAFGGPCKDHSYAPRLIPFKFRDEDTYTLEFGDQYMRVMRNFSHVVEDAVTITGITQADPGVVTADSHGYSDGDEVYISGVVGMTEVNGRRFIVANKDTNTFELTDQATGDNVDTSGYTAYDSAGETARVYEISTPYAIADVPNIKFVQSFDVMTLTHPGYTPRELGRTDHDAWSLAQIEFLPDQGYPETLAASKTGSGSGVGYRYKITAINDDTGEESLAGLETASAATITGITAADPAVVTATAHGFNNGDEVQIDDVVGMVELNGRRFFVAGETPNTFELRGEDSSDYTAYSSGGTATPANTAPISHDSAGLSSSKYITITWDPVDGASKYAVYRKTDDGVYGFIAETETESYKDVGEFEPDYETTPPRFREPFQGEGNYPGTVGYYQQRRVMGGSNNNPDRSEFSRVAAQDNFNASSPIQADDAFRASLTALEGNQILHYVPLTHLLVLTTSQEWRLDSGDQRFSFDTIQQKPQTRWGSSHHKPYVLGNVVMMVVDNEMTVRSIGYELAVDQYTGTDMTLLASHIFRDYTISDWALAKSNDSKFYIVRSDGLGAIFTFNQEQEVIAWSRFGTRTPDKLEQVTAVPAGGYTDDVPHFVVKRTINGNTVRYIEYLMPRTFTRVEDCFFVDCGLSYDQPIAVEGVTLADPVSITVPSGHGLQADDVVEITEIEWVADVDSFYNETQPDQLNDGRYAVKTAGATTITLKDADSGDDIDGTAFNAYVSGGEVRKVVSTLSGFHHLAGETVVGLLDGSVYDDIDVEADGSVTLPTSVARAHLGFRYVADVELLDIEALGTIGRRLTLQGRRLNVHELLVRVLRTVGLWVGPDQDNLVDAKQRTTESYSIPTGLMTGDLKLSIPAKWNSYGRVLLRQMDPLPLTILAAVPFFESEDLSDE